MNASSTVPAPKPPVRILLDSGAVIALSRDDHRVGALIKAAIEDGHRISVPAVTVAETVRGGPRDAPLNLVLKRIGEVDEVDEPIARRAGALLAAAGSSATIDAIVVATAIAVGGGVVVTSDPSDLTALAEGHTEVRIAPI